MHRLPVADRAPARVLAPEPVAARAAAAEVVVGGAVVAGGGVVPVEGPVGVGVSADGFVAVEPTVAGALSPGDQVVVGR